MRIERLAPDPRRPGVIRVVVDGHPAWSVPREVVIGLRLAVGGGVGQAELAALDRAADEEAAVRAGVAHLERRGHSRHELARKLVRKGHPDGAIEVAMARLAELGLLDDAAFARSYVTSRAGRGRSPTRIRQDLHALGVDREIAREAVATLETDDSTPDPLDRTMTQARRRAAAMASLPVTTRRRRLLAFLARRGWAGREARSLVEVLLRPEE